MFTNLHGATKALFFYLIAIALSTLFSLLSVAWDQSFWIGIPTMLTPTVAVLVMLLVITRDGYTGAGWRSLGVHRFGWRAWPLAFLAPLLLLVSSYTITWLLGVAQWRGDFGGSIGQWAIKSAPDEQFGLAGSAGAWHLQHDLGRAGGVNRTDFGAVDGVSVGRKWCDYAHPAHYARDRSVAAVSCAASRHQQQR